MKSLLHLLDRSCPALCVGVTIVMLCLAMGRTQAQSAVVTNAPAPVGPVVVESAPVTSLFVPPLTTGPVVASGPAPAAPSATSNPPPSSRKKSKGPVFSEVPDEAFQPVPAAVPAPTNVMESLDEKYRLAIGDRLSFRIVEDEEGPKSLTVTDSGELEMPYLGRFRGVGRTCRELAHALKTEFEKEYYYQATVIVAVDSMTRSRGKVYLVGPVRSPGPLEVPSDEVLTLSKAVLRAGGFTDFADRRNVKVTRKAAGGREDEIFTVNVAEILEKGKTDTDLPLEPGDLIYIQERMIRF